MALQFEITDPTRHRGWDDLVISSRGHSPFHTSWWAKILSDSYGYRPCYLTGIEDGQLSFLVPMMEIRSLLTGRKGVSLPFTDSCEPIIDDWTRWSEILDRLKAFGENARWKYIEIRGGVQLEAVPCSSRYYHHDIDLTAGLDAVYKNLKNKVRKNIRKAGKSGVVIRKSSSSEAIRTYYELHCLTRKKHGLPPQPMKFFSNLHQLAVSRDNGCVFLAEHQGKPIAGAVFLHFGKEAIYKYGASNAKYLNLCPNDLILWEAIQDYAGQGYGRFSFGRTDHHNQGLLDFKRGWGGAETGIMYHTYDLRRNEFVTGSAGPKSIHTNILGSLPVPALKLAGALLYRHMG